VVSLAKKPHFLSENLKLSWTPKRLNTKLTYPAIWPVLCFFDLKIVDTIRNGKKSNQHNLSTFKE